MNMFITILLVLYLLAFLAALTLSLLSGEMEVVAAAVFGFLVVIPLLTIPLWLSIWLLRLAFGS
ncbi:MAG: hypothetical protein ISN26_07635 [Betaproteobacteria bacterium AqS2]|uniref:Uncharacterized protein n=1 Tax=Candidatus Amphirhobacter heronislandensis TaxID=1732024 RepID=A0A930UIM3_9GAMM|nr:hypothetical protein [Betaproteobacteria bacterium AqS2]